MPTTVPPAEAEQAPIRTFTGNEEDVRAMKRALARAPLGPKATLALTAAIIALDEESADGPSGDRAQGRPAD